MMSTPSCVVDESKKFDGKILESVVILAKKLSYIEENKKTCDLLRKTYRPLLESCGPRKRDKIEKDIYPTLLDCYSKNKEDIMDKDFSFLNDTPLLIQEVDISPLVSNIYTCEDDVLVKDVINELLFMFSHIMPTEDRDVVFAKYGKKEQAPAPSSMTPSTSGGDPGKLLEKLLSRNKNLIKRADKDPNARNTLMKKLIEDSTDDLVGMLTGIIQQSGLDDELGK